VEGRKGKGGERESFVWGEKKKGKAFRYSIGEAVLKRKGKSLSSYLCPVFGRGVEGGRRGEKLAFLLFTYGLISPHGKYLSGLVCLLIGVKRVRWKEKKGEIHLRPHILTSVTGSNTK